MVQQLGSNRQRTGAGVWAVPQAAEVQVGAGQSMTCKAGNWPRDGGNERGAFEEVTAELPLSQVTEVLGRSEQGACPHLGS